MNSQGATPPSSPALGGPVVPRIVYGSAGRTAPVHGPHGPHGPHGLQQAARAVELERRRPSAPTYLVAPPRQAELGRRASAQAEGLWPAASAQARRASCGRGSSELGSGASLHVLAERLSQPLPSRRCSLLDERSRRLSKFADESVGLAGAAAAKRRTRRLVTAVALLILVAAVAMVGFSLTMPSRIDELSEYQAHSPNASFTLPMDTQVRLGPLY